MSHWQSSTCPPPSVCVADDSRTTKGWPQAAVTGSSRKTWARPHLPGSTVSQSRRETVAITSAVPLNIPAMHSSVDPAFAIELDDGRTLVLLGQWLSDPKTFGGTWKDLPEDDDGGDAFANGLPPPYAFPTSAFTVERFPVSGTVVRIGLAGDYLAPADLAVDLRQVNDYPSRIYETPPSGLPEAVGRSGQAG